MVATTDSRAGARGAVAAASLSLALWSLAARPAEARQTAAREPTVAEATVPPIDLIGPWLRNEELSEAPSLDGETIQQGPEDVAGFVSDLAESLGDRLDAVLIQVDGDTLLLLNGRGELSSFRLGRERYTDRLGNEIRLLTASGGFRIETRISGWLRVETFSRKDDRLVRVTEIRRTGFSGLELRTVYDPVGTEHRPLLPPPAGRQRPRSRSASCRPAVAANCSGARSKFRP